MQLNQYIGNISCSSQNEEGFSEILSRISINFLKNQVAKVKLTWWLLGVQHATWNKEKKNKNAFQ